MFSKTDMNIGGSGLLTVNANFNHGISSKDDLVIEGGGYTVTSAVDAIRGKDSLVILNGKLELNAGGDGTFNINSRDDAVHSNDSMEARQKMLDAYPFMKKTYAADDGNMQVLYFKDATATFDSFSGEHEVITF